jgi:glycosyltransferase involved in cell wall biosynthesis
LKVWLVTGGEPLPIGEGRAARLYRTGLLMRYLTAHGHDVTWWTPNFDHRSKLPIRSRPEVLELSGNGRIRLLASSGYKKNLSVQRLIDHAFVARDFRAASGREASPDVVVVAMPTLELAAEALRFGRGRNVPVVLDLRDMWPEVYVWHMPVAVQGIARAMLSPLFRRRNRYLSEASAVWAVSEEFLQWGLECGGRKRSSFDGAFLMLDASAEPGTADLDEARRFWDGVLGSPVDAGMIGCFVGSINHQFDLETVALATAEARSRGARVRCVLAGDGETMGALRDRFGPESGVIWTGWIDRARLLALFERCDFGLDPMPDRPDFVATINNKALDYLKAGLGVVSSPAEGALARLLRERGCGASYPKGDREALVRLFLRLSSGEGIAGCWAESARRLAAEELLEDRVYGGMMGRLAMIVESQSGGRRAKAIAS